MIQVNVLAVTHGNLRSDNPRYESDNHVKRQAASDRRMYSGKFCCR